MAAPECSGLISGSTQQAWNVLCNELVRPWMNRFTGDVPSLLLVSNESLAGLSLGLSECLQC